VELEDATRNPFSKSDKVAMAAWDDVIDFDNVGEWPMELSGWLKLHQSHTDQEQRSQTVQLVRKCLQGARIKTYHCRRLLPSEVESIKVNGLQPASPELARDKREAARNAGRPLPFWAQENPSAKIWFYHRKSDLDAAIAGPLLRSWGGKELLIGSRGIVDSAAKPHIITFNCPVAELKYVFGNGWCALETKIVNQYLAQSSPVAPADIAFESCSQKPVRVEASDIVSPEDARFSDLTNYWDDLHFHVA
jgi:hypothetical protein